MPILFRMFSFVIFLFKSLDFYYIIYAGILDENYSSIE